MVVINSYVLDAAQGKVARDINPKDAAPRLLKTIADMLSSGKKESCSTDELLSASGLPVPVVTDAIQLLLRSGMIEEAASGGYRLTATGERTHLLVAS
jgi:predicted transcriptional regulator